jgi:hypothetical protein
VVPPGKNEIANETLVPVDDEVAAKFFWLFVFVY